MANDEDLARLRQGVAVWNDWRAQNRERFVDLRGADLAGADLNKAILDVADLSRAKLGGGNLSRVNFSRADLRRADLRRADLHWANLQRVDLRRADLRLANLRFADLRRADLGEVDLSGANLTGANLIGANLDEADLSGASLTEAKIYRTVFANLDLSATKDLETCTHWGPSVLDHRTLQRSGRLPSAFLRGCGLPDRLIDYLPSLLDEAIQYYSCFISFSTKDEALAKRLHADLQDTGVRCWFAPEDMKIGDKFRHRIDEAIHVHERVLLILSENSVSSEWVEKEVETAFEKEQRQKRTVLFPVRLDDAVMECDTGWSADIRRTRHIGDFRRWKEENAYRKSLSRLVKDLTLAAAPEVHMVR